MIAKYFYDEEDYKVVLYLLNGYHVSKDDIERVKTRQLFLKSFEK